MKRSIHFLLLAVLALCISAVSASRATEKDGDQKMVPVFVQVDNTGKVTRIEPPMSLRPSMEKALEQTVKTMIHKPAVKNGKPVSSQFVLYLALVPDEQANDEYRFSYLSAQPVPSGTYHWVNMSPHGDEPRYRLQSNFGAPVDMRTPPDYRAPSVRQYPAQTKSGANGSGR